MSCTAILTPTQPGSGSFMSEYAMSRPQVGIDRLPARRMNSEPRESMNCKSCRKRKIKCNRMRPTCEACSVFQCPCIYDAIPKKRGPKSDVLEALLKRVDGLEKRLQDEKKPLSPAEEDGDVGQDLNSSNDFSAPPHPPTRPPKIETDLYSPTEPNPHSPLILPETVLDIFFSRIHGKPYHILDEQTTRQMHALGQLSPGLLMAIYAVTARYETNNAGYEAASQASHELAVKARAEVDLDEPSIDSLQTLLLLSMAFFANGKGKRAYMALVHSIGMAFSLELHREVPPKAKLLSTEREMRRRLFWTCYMMDRFASCGSKRPSIISDRSVFLRLPSFNPHQGALPIEGETFTAGPNVQFAQDSRRQAQGPAGLLIDIVRILGVTNRYLAAGGVKGDSHFPWHSLSNLSKIRQELDIWAAGTQDTFASIETLFGQPESTTLLLSKLVYHLIHCLIYRPFLPIDLAELRGTGQHQSWQIEATNLCFLHANAIAELVELGKTCSPVEWPAFVGYCVCTAGTVHVHGIHYKGRDGEAFALSPDFLNQEIHQLAWLRDLWNGVQHQRATLEKIYNCHAELVKSLSSSSMRFSPVFHLEDFFDRYPGHFFDGSHVTLSDLITEADQQSAINRANALSNNPSTMPGGSAQHQPTILGRQPPPQQQQQHIPPSTPTYHHHHQHQRPKSRRRSTAPSKPGPPLISPATESSFAIPPPPQTPRQSFQPSPGTPKVSTISFTPLPDFSTINPPLSAAAENYSSPGNVFSYSPSDFPHAVGGPTPGSEPIFAPTPPPTNPQYATYPFSATPGHQNGAAANALTPGSYSQTSGSHSERSAGVEKDPFLSLLEQLAENEGNDKGGPSELDFFLGSTGGEGMGLDGGGDAGNGMAA